MNKKPIDVMSRLIGMKAVEKQFISEKQLVQCMNHIDFFEPDASLDQVMLSKGFLTQRQIGRLKDVIEKEMMGGDEPSTKTSSKAQKKKIGELALEQNMLDDEQLMDAIEEQEIFLERGVRVQLGQIFLQQGFLTQAQLKRLLESQSRKTLVCKKCKITKIVHNYESSQLHTCENTLPNGDVCGLDMTVAKVKPKRKPKVQKETEDDDIGGLQVLEL